MLESLNQLDESEQKMVAPRFLQQYYAVKMVIAVGCDDLQQIKTLLIKCQLANEQYSFSDGVVHNTMAIALAVFNQPHQALIQAKLGLESHRNCNSMIGVFFANGIQAMIKIQCCELNSAVRDIQQGYRLLHFHRVSEKSLPSAIIRVLDGVIHYLKGDSRQAILLLSDCIPHMDQCAFVDLRNICYTVLARSLSQEDDFSSSLSLLNNSLLCSYECNMQRRQAKIVFEKVRLYIENDKLNEALGAIEQQKLTQLSFEALEQWDDIMCYNAMSYCLYSIFNKKNEDIILRLDHLIELAHKATRLLQKVEILLFKALYFSQQQQLEQCSQAIEAAIVIAQPKQLYAPFCQPLVVRDHNILLILSREHTIFMAKIAPQSHHLPPPKSTNELLTSREHSILKLIATGGSNQEIATQLSLSVNTIRWHVSNILSKLMVSNRTEAVAIARSHGIVV